MSGQLIALDKHPGVRPVGIGETWRRLLAQIALKVTGPEEKIVCQDDQLCTVIKARIYEAIHGVQALWDKNSSTEEWYFLLDDAKNAFNKINRVGML